MQNTVEELIVNGSAEKIFHGMFHPILDLIGFNIQFFDVIIKVGKNQGKNLACF